MSVRINIFNQYYLNLLKRLKDNSKKNRENKDCHKVLKAIKKNYSSYDKLDPSFLDNFKESFNESYENWNTVSNIKECDEWIEKNKDYQLYKDISIETISKTIDNNATFINYFILTALLAFEEISDEEIVPVVELVKKVKDLEVYKEEVSKLGNENVKRKLLILSEYQEEENSKIETSMKGLENTSLGKLAKEIMGEIDTAELENIANNPDGDILKTLTNPDSGLMKLFTSVSQKMISKISSGELKQENLLQDAMAFSSQLQGVMPPGMGNFAQMMSQMQNMNMGAAKVPTGTGMKTRSQLNKTEISRIAKQKQLRRRLEDKKKSKKEVDDTNLV